MRNSIILIGRTINLASRLQEIARNDEILISNKLKNMIQDDFEFSEISIEDRLKNRIKSFQEEKVAYVIMREKDNSQENEV